MKSKHSIEFDFQKALREAEELEQIAGEMRRMAENELQPSLQTLSAAWKGEAASGYLSKGGILKEKILRSAADLDSTASAIRNVARRIYKAEMRAYRIAVERNYSG